MTIQRFGDFHGKTDCFDFNSLRTDKVEREDYLKARASLVRACHDIFIKYSLEGRTGILVSVRQEDPAKGDLWVPGGGIERGYSTEDSLKRKVKLETNLDIREIEFLTALRFMWDPLPESGFPSGVDDIGLGFFALGNGELRLDHNHSQPQIITRLDYLDSRDKFHPYMRYFMDLLIEKALI